MKIGSDTPIYNEITPKGYNGVLRCPPDRNLYDEFNIPPALIKELDDCKYRIFGKKGDELHYDPNGYRMCWLVAIYTLIVQWLVSLTPSTRDMVCPDGDFLITRHPHSRNLVIATGGSYHGFKFLPLVGKYILEIVTGEAEEEIKRRWGWDRNNGGDADEGLPPSKRLSDLFDGKGSGIQASLSNGVNGSH
ncbi:hypothetical protein ABW19_dt0206158 [Dactylella cylindrospora]|nr:hypothetical protein ABW19_dt0206158 [Dactylella cylindrospora]